MTTHLTDTQKTQIRIALAKWEGWRETPPYDGEAHCNGWILGNGKFTLPEHLPNYPASLDACHEIEVKLTDEEHREFRHVLRFIVNMESVVASDRNQRDYLSANSEHRSLALFRALNLGELGD